MKLFNVSKRTISIIALLLVMVMVFSGCGGKEGTEKGDGSSSAIEDVDNSVSNESGEATERNETTNGDSSTQSTVGQQNNQSSSGSKPTASKNNQTATSSQGQQLTQTAKKTTWDKDYLSGITDSVRKKGIHMLMWRQLDSAEEKVISKFEKETGMKVRVTVTTETEYNTKLISLISSKDSPDVVSISSSVFPAIAVKACQPLDKYTFRLDDKCWNKSYMDPFSINGNYYSVAMYKSPNCDDTNYVTYYLKSVLNQCGVTTMPYDLYKQGKWDWAKQKEIMSKVAANGLKGMETLHYDTFMHSAGLNFVKYDGKQYTNNMTDKKLLTAWQQVTSLKTDGLLHGWDKTSSVKGKVGLFTCYTYQGLKDCDLYHSVQGGLENINAVPVAGPTADKTYTPCTGKGWGTPKGAKNVEGAAYFLRYFLDVSNVDNYNSLFLNDQIREVYDLVCGKNTKKTIAYDRGIIDFTKKDLYYGFMFELAGSTPANIQTAIDAKKGVVNNSIRAANKILANLK